MPRWIPQPVWQHQDACIIGGGSSLRNFNFDQIKGRNVIGCNDAYRLGASIVTICLFSDSSFFHRSKWDLEKFEGLVVTCAPGLLNYNLSWLLQIPRHRHGLHVGPMIGWNCSTGAAAVNLAISLGAVRIFLLGFDMTRQQDGRSHWHGYGRVVQDTTYQRFIQGFASIHRELPKFPGVRVFNVTDGSSKLPFFPRMSFDVFSKYVPLKDRRTVRCIPCEQRAKEVLQRASA